MAKCPICNKRSAKRMCPAKKVMICPKCCGLKRLKEIKCVPTCDYLEQHQRVEAEKSMEEEQALAPSSEETQLNLDGIEYAMDNEFIKDAEEKLYTLVQERGDIADRHIIDALAESVKYYETMAKGKKHKKKIFPDNTEAVYYTIYDLYESYKELDEYDYKVCADSLNVIQDVLNYIVEQNPEYNNPFIAYLEDKYKVFRDKDEAEFLMIEKDSDDDGEARYVAQDELSDEELDEKQKKIYEKNKKLIDEFNQTVIPSIKTKHNLNDKQLKEYKQFMDAYLNDYLVNEITRDINEADWEDFRDYVNEYYIDVDGPESPDLKKFINVITEFYNFTESKNQIDKALKNKIFEYINTIGKEVSVAVDEQAEIKFTPDDFIVEDEKDEKRVAKNIETVLNGYKAFLEKEKELDKQEALALFESADIFQKEFLDPYLKMNIINIKKDMIRSFLGNWYIRRLANPNMDFVNTTLKSIENLYEYLFELGLINAATLQNVKKETSDVDFYENRIDKYNKATREEKEELIKEYDYSDFL